MIPLEESGVDADLLATVAVRLRAALPPPPVAVPPWTWAGRARTQAAAALDRTLALHHRSVAALAAVADALAAAAPAFGRAAELDRTALRLVHTGTSAGAPARLRADAAAERATTDAALAARLHALAAETARVDLPPLVVGADPETGWLGRPLAEVPPDLLAAVAALEPAVTAGDPRAPVALRLETAPLVVEPSLLGDGARFLLAADGRVAEVWGDVTAAERVVVLVPGTGTATTRFDEAHAHGEALADALGPGAAVVVWLGARLPATLPAAALQRWAKAAAPALTAFVDGLGLHPGQRLTLVGHSYGGVVAGLAVREGLRPAALVGVAPAGFGPKVRSTADLGGVPTYVLEDARDPIRDVAVVEGAIALLAGPLVDRLAGAAGLGHLGDDPLCLPGTVRLASPDDDRPRLPVGADATIHSEYFAPGSEGLAQLVAVAQGRPVATVGCP